MTSGPIPYKRTGRPEIDDHPAHWVIGSDEAGLGNWAGSLIVAAVAVVRTWDDPEVTDSKQLKDEARYAAVRRHKGLVLWAVQQVTVAEIDEKGVHNANIEAHVKLHQKLADKIDEKYGPGTTDVLHISDGLENFRSRLLLPNGRRIIPLSKGDTLVPAVSLASCFAKVSQCMLMDKLHKEHPLYGFDTGRGYGTKDHTAALDAHGVIPGVHRTSYSPIKRRLQLRMP